jgi:oligo-1,6-glucosidase
LHSVFLENHDYVRSVSRLGNDSDDKLRTISAKMLAVLQISQSGTLFVYQGEEIAMRNVPKSWGIEEYKDPPALGYYQR